MIKSRLFNIYCIIVLALNIIALFCSVCGCLIETFPSSDRMVTISHNLHNITHIIGCILALSCTIHLSIIFFQSVLRNNRHSFMWLLIKQGRPIIVSIIFFIIIGVLAGNSFIRSGELISGVLSGMISSVLVLLLDHNHTLASKILDTIYPDLQNKTTHAE